MMQIEGAQQNVATFDAMREGAAATRVLTKNMCGEKCAPLIYLFRNVSPTHSCCLGHHPPLLSVLCSLLAHRIEGV